MSEEGFGSCVMDNPVGESVLPVVVISKVNGKPSLIAQKGAVTPQEAMFLDRLFQLMQLAKTDLGAESPEYTGIIQELDNDIGKFLKHYKQLCQNTIVTQ